MTKRALITGITGQDGSYLAELLLEKGYEVHGIKRRASSFNTQRVDHIYEDPHTDNARFRLHYGDLTDSSNLTRIIQEVQPDEVYNLGAQSHVAVSFEAPEYTADVDAMGTLRLLEAIRFLGLEKKTRFYQASTSELYGLVQETPQTETTLAFKSKADSKLVRRPCDELPNRVLKSRRDHEILGIILLQHHPLHTHIVLCMSPIPQGVDIAHVETVLQTLRDIGQAAGNLSGHEGLASARTFVVKKNAVAGIHIVGFAVIDGDPIGIHLGHRVRAARVEGGEGEVGIVEAIEGDHAPVLSVGDVIMRIDPRYFRPAEVETLLGHPAKAKARLGWVPEITAQQMCTEMVVEDLKAAKQHAFLKSNGYDLPVSIET